MCMCSWRQFSLKFCYICLKLTLLLFKEIKIIVLEKRVKITISFCLSQKASAIHENNVFNDPHSLNKLNVGNNLK